MAQQQKTLGVLRSKILADPEFVLNDQDIMNALINANERSKGSNIVDLREIAMERLENKLDKLEDTHKSVVAAAYDNLAGTHLIHTAVLRLLEVTEFPAFLKLIESDLPEILRVAHMRLVLESHEHNAPSVGLDEIMSVVGPGVVDHYISAGRNIVIGPVTLRQVAPASEDVYGDKASTIQSEALLKLNLGEGRLPGMLVLGSNEPEQFRANQGTDLLLFFGATFERMMQRWLG